MKPFDVYTLWPIEPVRAEGCRVWDRDGIEYLDLYGGHAVISIGHAHPKYIKSITNQLNNIGFYSNSVINSLQEDYALKLGAASGYPNYSLFLCNSGAEANENALKLASFHTGRKNILAFNKAFHGRTSGAVEATDNDSIKSPFNKNGNVAFIPLNDTEATEKELSKGTYAAVIIEGILGVAGIYQPDDSFLKDLRVLCDKYGTLLILDEIQSGFGRSGKFFAHQYAGICPDIITVAKGMANGFPMGGVLISPSISAKKGMLGTTFGGSHLACAAAISTLDIIEDENLIENAKVIGDYIADSLKGNIAIKELRGRGLMIGIEIYPDYSEIKERLLFQEHIFTGGAGKSVIRILPPLCISKEEADLFIDSFNKITELS